MTGQDSAPGGEACSFRKLRVFAERMLGSVRLTREKSRDGSEHGLLSADCPAHKEMLKMVNAQFHTHVQLFFFGKNFTCILNACWCLVDTQCCASLRAQQSAPTYMCHTCVIYVSTSFPDAFSPTEATTED